MGEQAEPADARSVVSLSALPPLRIHHLLVWIAVTAIFAGANRGIHEEIAWWWILALLPTFFGATFAFTSLGFGLWWRRRGLPYPSAPGHWMCVIAGVATVMTILRDAFYAFASQLDVMAYRVSILPVIVLYVWIGTRFCDQRHWKWYFLIAAVFLAGEVFPGVGSWVVTPVLTWLNGIWSPLYGACVYTFKFAELIPPCVLLMTCWVDHCRQVPRHWSHWAGVGYEISQIPAIVAVALINTGLVSIPVAEPF